MCHCFAHSFVIKLYCEQEKKAMPFGSLPLFLSTEQPTAVGGRVSERFFGSSA